MILGMDGGGSKTRFMLTSQYGNIVAEHYADGCNYQQVGLQNLQQTIKDGLSILCQKAQIALDQLQYAVLGVPAYGEIERDRLAINALIAKLLSCPYSIVNDVKLAWAGALACQPGVVILSGTGSMAYGVDHQGNDLRCGGWGHYFSDEGSAFWLGRKCCQLFSKMADGRVSRGPLYGLVRQKLQIEKDFDLVDLLVKSNANFRKELAAMAKILAQAAAENDEEANKIFARAGHELAAMIYAVINKFLDPKILEPNKLLTSYAGGAFKSGPFLLNQLTLALEQANFNIPLSLQTPLLEPVTGACLYGAVKLGWERADYADKLSQHR